MRSYECISLGITTLKAGRAVLAGAIVASVLLVDASVASAGEGIQTDIELSSGNIVLSNTDGTQVSMSPGSDVSLGRDDDGASLLTINAGEIYFSNVLNPDETPMRIRMGDTVVEINRASVVIDLEDEALNVTLLHGRGVTFSTGAPPLTKAGTRMRLGQGAPRTDRPSVVEMAAIKGAVGIIKPVGAGVGGPITPPQGPAGGNPALPASPQVSVPGQIVQQGLRPPAPPAGNAPPGPAGPGPGGGGGLTFDDIIDILNNR